MYMNRVLSQSVSSSDDDDDDDDTMCSGAFLGFADGGAETRPEGPRCEARRAESGGGVPGEGAAAKRFYYILSTQDGLS